MVSHSCSFRVNSCSSIESFLPWHDTDPVRYKDTICAQQTKGSVQDKCLSYFPTFTIASVMFTCEDPASNPQPTSTSTATVSRIAGMATSQPTSHVTTLKTSVSITGGSPSPTSGATEGSGGPSENGSSSENASGKSSSSLSMSDKIAIGVGLGVGLPTILITLTAWLCPCRGGRWEMRYV